MGGYFDGTLGSDPVHQDRPHHGLDYPSYGTMLISKLLMLKWWSCLVAFLLALGIFCLAQEARTAGVPTIFGSSPYGYQPTINFLPTTVTQGSATSGGPLSWLTNYSGSNHYNVVSGNALTCFSSCGFQALVNFASAAQYYNFQIAACMFAAPGDSTTGQTMWFLDQGAVGWNNSGTFTQQVTNTDPSAPCGTTVTYTWKLPVQSGNHLVQLFLSTDPATFLTVNTASITATTGTVLPEPAGSRDATRFPLSSYSLWNTAVGSDATWCAPTDGDCTTLNGLTGVINSGSFSIPIYTATMTDPVQIFAGSPNVVVPNQSVSMHMPAGMTPSPDSDALLGLVDTNNPRYMIEGLEGCTVTASGANAGVSCLSQQIHDNCNPALDYGLSQQHYAGLIRAADITAGAIKHVINVAFGFANTKAVTNVFATQWPN